MTDRDRDREFRTGEHVVEPGPYVCEVGEAREYGTNEDFAACPETGRETTWRRQERK